MTHHRSRIAIDIETVSPDYEYWETPDFRDSNDFELLAVALAYQEDRDIAPESSVLLRDGWGPESEMGLIEEIVLQIEAMEADVFLSYNGEAFDYPHLRGRVRLVADELNSRPEIVERVDMALRSGYSDDLKNDVWEAFGDYTTLEDACTLAGLSVEDPKWRNFAHGLNPDEFRTSRQNSSESLNGADIAQFGEYYLDWCDEECIAERRFGALEQMLRAYATSDVIPLFQLADARPFD